MLKTIIIIAVANVLGINTNDVSVVNTINSSRGSMMMVDTNGDSITDINVYYFNGNIDIQK